MNNNIGNGKKIKVLVVDDSAFYRQSLVTLLEKSPMIEVIGIASDGLEAIKFLSDHKPDVITLDLEMPKIDGITFFRWMIKNKPIPSIVISSVEGGKNTLMALDMGAVDFIAKPSRLASMEFMKIEDILFKTISAIADISAEKLLIRTMMSPGDRQISPGEKTLPNSKFKKIVVIGSSTGGPSAVQKVIGDLPGNFPYPILISQHMPEGFTNQFSKRLDKLSQISVTEARSGLKLQSGTAYICPGLKHMEIFTNDCNDHFINILNVSENDMYSPSVNIMMKSVAKTFKGSCISVILTGMGNDGLEGVREIKNMGGYSIAEAEETALIYGMPKEIIINNLADAELPLQFIGRELVKQTV